MLEPPRRGIQALRGYTPGVGFNPYSKIRRARMTRRGDVAFLLTGALLIALALAWTVL